jgi:hypothetical protein
MKYSIQIGSVAMIYIPSLIKICSGIQQLMWGGRHTGSMEITEAYFRKGG